MPKKFIIILTLILCFLNFSEIHSQSLLKNEEIPKDLLITYEISRVSKLLIEADGSVTYYPISVTTITRDGEEVNGFIMSESDEKKFEKVKEPEKKHKLSNSQLKELISEFEKIQFFYLPDMHATTEDGCIYYVSGPNSENTISIQIGGQSKKITYFSGCISNMTNDFKNLVDKTNKIISTIEIKVDDSLNVNKNFQK